MKTPELHNQQELLQQIAGGDVASFRVIFDAYRKRLYGAALKIVKSPQMAEDVVQDIFIALWEGRTNLKNVQDVSAYIFTIGYNKSFYYLKKIAAEAVFTKKLQQHPAAQNNETEEKLDLKESRELIQQAVRQLPAQRRLIYQLSREEGLSHDQIAQRLNISPLTVKKQIVLALQNIRASLAKISPLFAAFLF